MRSRGSIVPSQMAGRYASGGRRYNIVCYGNSLTSGNGGANTYPAALQTMRPGDTVINLGAGGKRTADMITGYASDKASIAGSLVAGKPVLVLAWESIDEMDDWGATPAQEWQNLKDLAAVVHAAGDLIIVAPAIPCTDTSGNPAVDVPALAALLRANHSWADGFADLNAGNIFDPNDALVYAAAGGTPNVHLTDYGYTVPLARKWNDAVNQMVR